MGLFTSAKCTSSARLDGKTAVITGCNTGIGKETVKDFFKRGAKVIMACRNTEAANRAAEDIKKEESENTGEIQVIELDLSSLESVRKCAENLKKEEKINILVNNAGIMMCPFTKSKDGYELQFATNHLGHFLFTLLLLPKLIESQPSRIVIVSSRLHNGKLDFDDLNFERKPYDAAAAYKQSKQANILFAKELDRKLKENNVKQVTTYSLHPGVIASDLGRNLDSSNMGMSFFYKYLAKYFAKNVEQGAQTSIYCSVDEKCESASGFYYAECRINEPADVAKNMNDAKILWDVSWELVGLEEDYDPFKNVKKDSTTL